LYFEYLQRVFFELTLPKIKEIYFGMSDYSDSDDEFYEFNEAHGHHQQTRHFNEKVFEDELPEILRRQQVRVPNDVVNYLEDRLKDQLQYKQPRKGMLTVHEQLLLFLHFAGTNSFFHVLRDVHGPSASTVFRTVHRVALAISTLQAELVTWPEDTSGIAAKFFNIANFPCVAGTLDGTHVSVMPPKNQEDDFVNRHHQHSINVLAVAGPRREFFYVNTKFPGKCHDSHVLQSSSLWRDFDQGWRPFENAVLLADSAYPVKEWLLTPFRGAAEGPQARYNAAHMKTRSIVEQAFGVIKKRFYILQTGIRFRKMTEAACIIKACFVIHNLCIKFGDYGEEQDVVPEEDLQPLAQADDQANPSNPRNVFLQYFRRN